MIKFIILIFSISISFSQVFSTYDYTGTKATAMSGAITSGPGDIHSIFHNPAQLSTLKGFTFVTGYSEIFGQEFLPYYNLGFSYDSYAFNFEKLSTKLNDVELSSESAIGISKGYTFYKDRQSLIQSGFRLNFYQFDLGSSSGSFGDGSDGISLGKSNGYGLDIGFQGILNQKFYIAYYMQNIISSNIGLGLGNNLPQTLSIGLSYKPYEDLLTSFDINQLAGNSQQEIRFGIEYLFSEKISLMTGIQNNPNRFSAGFKYKFLENYSISYGILTHHIMPSTHQLTFSLDY